MAQAGRRRLITGGALGQLESPSQRLSSGRRQGCVWVWAAADSQMPHAVGLEGGVSAVETRFVLHNYISQLITVHKVFGFM
jgi:hypothetical protein